MTYGAYQANEYATWRLSVNNLTDQRYVLAGGLFLGPSRTARLGVQFRF